MAHRATLLTIKYFYGQMIFGYGDVFQLLGNWKLCGDELRPPRDWPRDTSHAPGVTSPLL